MSAPGALAVLQAHVEEYGFDGEIAAAVVAIGELLAKAENVVWKLSFNHETGPATITREDATARQLVEAIAHCKELQS